MSSSSSTPASLRESSYDVFISHGPDVRKTLASHLYRRLASVGITAFPYRQESQEGANLTSQIQDAIETASVHIAILSLRCAESSLCLNELLLMLQSTTPLVPLFYHVDPSDFRHTKALRELKMKKTNEGKPQYNSNTIEKWSKALSTVASISGCELKAFNGDEADMLDKVVELVAKQMKEPLDVAKYPTGLAEKVEDLERTVLSQQHNGIVGIVGMAGIGKTTLAAELFNRKRSNYSRSYFLSNVRENIARASVLSLQTQLLKGLFDFHSHIHNSCDGRQQLNKRFLAAQVLLVLDDVADADQVLELLPHLDGVESQRRNSLILITSRDRDVFDTLGLAESSIYNLDGLNPQHSRELFCMHAFGHPQELPHYEHLVNQFLITSQGSPLFLKVFGAFLYGKNKSYWQSQLDNLDRTLPRKIKETLMISYDALEKQEQDLFLDIACVYSGHEKDSTLRELYASDRESSFLFEKLQNRCLVHVDDRNCIQMHAIFQELGKDIEKEASGENPFQRREWKEDIESSVTAKLRRIEIYTSPKRDDDDEENGYSEITWYRGVLKIYDAQDGLVERILGTVQNSPKLSALRWSMYPYSSLASWIPVKNLRVLLVAGMGLKTLWKQAPPLQLRHLAINAPLENIPDSIGRLQYLECVRVFFQEESDATISEPEEEQEYSEQFWNISKWSPVPMLRLPEEFCHLRSLTHLVLVGCTLMNSLPQSFGNLRNLEYLRLQDCESLERLPNSFRNLQRLKRLYLRGCRSLIISTETLGKLSAFQALDLSNCSKLEELPPQVVDQQSLQYLDLSDTNLKSLPIEIGKLSNLRTLILGSPLETLPDSIGHLTQLTILIISGCPLRKLSFKKAGPNAICPNLQSLTIHNCNDLVEVGILPDAIIKLEVHSCCKLREMDLGLSRLEKLTRLTISGCKEFEKLSSLETLVSLAFMCWDGCPKLHPQVEKVVWVSGIAFLIFRNYKLAMEQTSVHGTQEEQSIQFALLNWREEEQSI